MAASGLAGSIMAVVDRSLDRDRHKEARPNIEADMLDRWWQNNIDSAVIVSHIVTKQT